MPSRRSAPSVSQPARCRAAGRGSSPQDQQPGRGRQRHAHSDTGISQAPGYPCSARLEAIACRNFCSGSGTVQSKTRQQVSGTGGTTFTEGSAEANDTSVIASSIARHPTGLQITRDQ